MTEPAPPLEGPTTQPYLGLAEIAGLFEVKDGTTWRWQQRGILPAPDFLLSNRVPAWSRARLVDWGVRTGRLERATDGTVRVPPATTPEPVAAT